LLTITEDSLPDANLCNSQQGTVVEDCITPHSLGLMGVHG